VAFEFVSYGIPAQLLSMLMDSSGSMRSSSSSSAAGQVQAGQVQAGQVQAGQVQAGQVQAGQVQAGPISIESIIASQTTIYQQPELPEPITCPITLEPIEVGTNVMKITRCGHIFKEAALRRWLRRDARCPVCRGGL
jgi:hypothetical protein